jgi:hypothetical protein
VRVLRRRAIPLCRHAIASPEAAPPGSAASDSAAQVSPGLYACLKKICTRSFCDQFMVAVRSLSTMDECTFNGSIRWLRSTASPHFPPAPQISFCSSPLYLLREFSCLFSTVFGIMAVSSTAQRSHQPLLPRPSISVHSDLPKVFPVYFLPFSEARSCRRLLYVAVSLSYPDPVSAAYPSYALQSPYVPRMEDAVHASRDPPRCSQGWRPVSCVADEGRRAMQP